MSACNDLKCSELLCVPTQSLPPGYSTIFFEAAMSGGRARNTASAAELCRLMRLHVGHLDEEKYRASNYEDVVTEYEELMLDILALTERPNRSALEAAATLECRLLRRPCLPSSCTRHSKSAGRRPNL